MSDPHDQDGTRRSSPEGSEGSHRHQAPKAPDKPGKGPLGLNLRPASSNVDKGHHPTGQARPPHGSANVDNNQAPRPGPQGSANVDTQSQEGSGPLPASGTKDASNVDNKKPARPKLKAPKPQLTRPPHSENDQAPNSQSGKKPLPKELQFPGSSSEGKPKTSRLDPSKPPGPDPEILKRVRAAKKGLAEANKDLDQNVGATPSLKSPSAYAREHTTVSNRTSSQYLDRGRMLITRYKREQGIPQDYDDFSATEFVAWLLSRKPDLKSSTWRVYRQAAYHTLMGKPDPDIDDALDILDNDIVEGDDRAGRSQPKSDRTAIRTSSLKEKKFPKKDFDTVMAYLKYRSRSKMAPILMDWLTSTLATGLRPVEWRATAFQSYLHPDTGQEYVWLYVLNAKATNARGNGVVRTLDLSGLPSEITAAIKRMSDRGLEWHETGDFNTVKSQVGQLLYHVGEALFPRRKKHFSLYSSRHQFIANMKTLLSPSEVSALSGHVVTKTAREAYGRAHSAWEPEDIWPNPIPLAEEVATVRQSADFYRDRVEKLKLAGVYHGNTSSEFPT
ncbi:hypothetical protein LR948_18430 [Roseivivax sp. GX 12232]|uniref:hypothetical protein n=1 Tax=Roseivivax sp. GX 12232 TaxID=2900547 RepID=UPI001E36C492|nr:hypothetical protein [Roseivivax sp. GX 12232]MCE0507340.1 hypothetical protein [Roseivivax sp. GX 12232]